MSSKKVTKQPDVSIIIVHTFEKEMIRQTLRSIRRAAPKVSYEILLVDNNPRAGMKDVLDVEFSEVRYFKNQKNLGFGSAMNVGAREAKGRYIFIFNPDIVVPEGSIEGLVTYMDTHKDVGMCGPRLINPDGGLQFSSYRLPNLWIPVYRRTPLGRFPFAKKAVANYLMYDFDHAHEQPVDALIGAAMFCRAEMLRDVGLFDEDFFLYYEDNDLCRRFWEKGYRVMYFPGVSMTHYHRRATADGGLLKQLMNRMTWIQIHSALKYAKKYRGKSNPREDYFATHADSK